VAELVLQGALRAHAVTELARQCRIIGICVRDDMDVEKLLYGNDGLIAHAKADSVIAVHSTVTVDGLRRWASAASEKGIHVLDAPITGGASGAEAGTLCYMVGGSAALIERCRQVFTTSGSKIVHAGATGAGIAMKLCNNLMTYAAFAAIDEAARLARASGLSVESLIEVGRTNGVVTSQMEAFLTNRDRAAASGPEMLRKAFGPFAALARKDLAAALQSAERLKIALPTTERVHEVIENVFMGR